MIDFTCPSCGQFYSVEDELAGQKAQCEECGTKLIVPEIEGELDQSSVIADQPDAEPEAGVVQLKSSMDVDIPRGNVTISQFMSKHGIDGGVALADSNEPSSASELLVGKEGRKYDVGKIVAKGGMGAILNAKDLNIRRTVAMKVMLDPAEVAEPQILRFIEEAQVTGQLEHPSIVPVHELGVDGNDNVYYTMKYVKGVTLKQVLAEIADGRNATIAKYPLMHLLNIFLKACDAIAFAHEKGVIHRDLKPENIMVGEYGEELVMDWGLAKVLGADSEVRSSGFSRSGEVVAGNQSDQSDRSDRTYQAEALIESIRSDGTADVLKTMDGQVMGTPQFMAPEQALGKIDELDARADVYALGGILYNLLTLHPPIEGGDLRQILLKVTKGEITPPTTYNQSSSTGSGTSPSRKKRRRSLTPAEMSRAAAEASRKRRADGGKGPVPLPHCPGNRIPAPLSAVAMKALALDPEHRYQAVKELQADIEAYQSGFATSAEDAGLATQLLLLIKRHKTFVAAAVAVVLALVIGLAIALVQRHAAILARRDAQEQRDKAEAARDAEQRLREQAEYDAYVGRIAMIQQRLGDKAYVQAEKLLHECPERYRHWEWRRLKFLCQTSVFVLRGHENHVASARYSPDGRWIMTAGGGPEIRFWNAETGTLARTIATASSGGVRFAEFSPDGTSILSAGQHGTRVWRTE